jgi:hypothetical protein
MMNLNTISFALVVGKANKLMDTRVPWECVVLCLKFQSPSFTIKSQNSWVVVVAT